MRHRRSGSIAVTFAVALVFALVPLAPPADEVAQATSGLTGDDLTYTACGRVFPDPHAYWPLPEQAPERSPFAKGNAACASADFLAYDDMIDGLTYLEGLYPEFVEFYNLEEDFGDGDDCATSTDPSDYCSAGLPQTGGIRERSDLYMVRITDERVPDDDKRFFAFPLSIHGIERAGAEAGTRAAEDLATWAYCEAVAFGELADNGLTNCAQEGTIPHPLLETQPDTSLTTGDALRDSAIYLIFANADGWRRGDLDNLVAFYQRYNGNGVDMNRDFPNMGFTFRPYTPWSEPETRGFGEVLKSIRDQWDGGIDLHGQLIDRAFSFTLLGALPNGDFGQNQRILQTVKGAWADAEQRFEWSPLIKANDAAPDDPRLYGIQWGTVWDTIGYTVTGAFGDWIASPIGLGADGIDNEMSLSHLSNCGTGHCYLPDAEQLHIDGNKSLIYSMVNFTLLPEDNDFEVPGKVGYVVNPERRVHAGDPTPTPPPDLPTQDEILDATLNTDNDFQYRFNILGPDDGVYNGGVVATATPQGNLEGVGGDSLTSLILERWRTGEEEPGGEDEDSCGSAGGNWEEVNRYYNQSSIYLQSGQAVHANAPTPGPWRLCITGSDAESITGSDAESSVGDLATQLASSGGSVDVDIAFTEESAWADPGQLPYDVSNTDFFESLAPYMGEGQLVALDVDDILNGAFDLDEYDSVVIADNALPGYVEPPPSGPAQPNEPVRESPGLGTAPCAYQRGTTDVPGTIEPTPGCFNSFTFDVDGSFNNQRLIADLSSANADLMDWDLYLDRQDPNSGEWFEVGRSTTPTGNENVTVFTPPPGHYRALVVNWSAADPSSAETLTIEFSDEATGPPPEDSERSDAERDAWAAILDDYVTSGGNLVLTDGATRNLAWMGLVERSAVRNFSVYAGYIGFTTDGTDVTYNDPLAKDVNQPGAAEGTGHRHQTYEPVPLGFAILDEGGSDFNSAPAWGVDATAWEEAGGRVVGTTSANQMSLGELQHGDGVIRVVGSLLPMPTEEHYHPFGLASFALTYSGYQVLNNVFQWERPVDEGTPAAVEAEGGGWLETSDGAKANFGFDVSGGDAGPTGDLRLRDKAAEVNVEITELTSLQELSEACGEIEPGSNSVIFEGDGTHNGSSASFRVCVEDNGSPGHSRASSTPDLFHLECLSGCDYNTTGRVVDDAIDAGNIQVRLSDGSEAGASTEPGVLILDPVLGSEGLVGAVEELSVTAYDADGEPLADADITVEALSADGTTTSLLGVTAGDGTVVIAVTNLLGNTEYVASVGDLSSNAVNITGG